MSDQSDPCEGHGSVGLEMRSELGAMSFEQ
jgi:hypothetical protein